VNARGFTLLEVLVALAILGIAVVASIQGFAQGLRLLKLSGDHQEATLIADQKMREVVVPVEGREEGTETRFSWIRTVARLPTPEVIPGAGQPSQAQAQKWHLYQIDVQVRWDERREVHLSTMRTAPEGAVPPGENSPVTGTPTTPVAPSTRTDGSTGTTPRTGSPTTPRSPASPRTTPGTTPRSSTTR
jgi:general secretion pathway protein I